MCIRDRNKEGSEIKLVSTLEERLEELKQNYDIVVNQLSFEKQTNNKLELQMEGVEESSRAYQESYQEQKEKAEDLQKSYNELNSKVKKYEDQILKFKKNCNDRNSRSSSEDIQTKITLDFELKRDM